MDRFTPDFSSYHDLHKMMNQNTNTEDASGKTKKLLPNKINNECFDNRRLNERIVDHSSDQDPSETKSDFSRAIYLKTTSENQPHKIPFIKKSIPMPQERSSYDVNSSSSTLEAEDIQPKKNNSPSTLKSREEGLYKAIPLPPPNKGFKTNINGCKHLYEKIKKLEMENEKLKMENEKNIKDNLIKNDNFEDLRIANAGLQQKIYNLEDRLEKQYQECHTLTEEKKELAAKHSNLLEKYNNIQNDNDENNLYIAMSNSIDTLKYDQVYKKTDSFPSDEDQSSWCTII